MFAEPPPTAADLHFRLFGVPIRIHPFFWLIALVLGYQLREPQLMLMWVLCVFVSILIHEFGHVLAYRFYGWGGRIVLHTFGGLAIREDSHHPWQSRSTGDDGGWRQIVISLAGPAAGFVLAAVILALLYASDAGFDIRLFGQQIRVGGMNSLEAHNERLVDLVYFLLFINILWGLVNLLPVYPLDGGQMARELCLMVSPGQGIRWSLIMSVIAAGTMAAVALLAPNRPMIFAAFLFGYLAYQSYATLQSYGQYGGGRW